MSDLADRDIIRNDIITNLFVEAGAGSGKTTILVDRLINMVKNGISVDKICAITFTKAAANEFYKRFQDRLEKEIHSSSNSKEYIERFNKALNNIDLCFMGTIDSFCNMVLSEHPYACQIPAETEVKEDEEMSYYYKREYKRILNGEYGEELKAKALKISEYIGQDLDAFVNAVKVLADKRHLEVKKESSSKKNIDDLLGTYRENFIRIINFLFSNQHLKYDRSKDSIQSWGKLINYKNILKKSWNGQAITLLKFFDDIKGGKNKEDGEYHYCLKLIKESDLFTCFGPDYLDFFEAHITKDNIAWYELNHSFVNKIVSVLKNEQFAVLIESVVDAIETICDNLKKEGNLTYFDYLLYLRNLLKEDAKKGGLIAKHIYKRHQYFLIDEFQDTNPLQAEIFFYLSAKEPKEDWKECELQEGSLFIVGDPKQSIYKFRGADVKSYLFVKQLFEDKDNCKVVYLTSNYRSTNKMVEYFNNVYTRILPEETDNQSKFEEIPDTDFIDLDDCFGGVYYYDTHYNKDKVTGIDDKVTKVSEIIKKLVGNQKIAEKQDYGTIQAREIMYKDIMVITKSKTPLSKLTKDFYKNNIPFYVEGDVPFKACPSLCSAVSIFSYLIDSKNKSNIYSLLSSNYFNLNEKELNELKNNYGINETIIIDKFPGEWIILEEIKKGLPYYTAHSLLKEIIQKFRLFNKVGTYAMEYLYMALEILSNGEIEGDNVSLSDADKLLHNLIKGEHDIERSIELLDSGNCVRISNLHKVKGLESPIVILATQGEKSQQESSYTDNINKQHWQFSIPLTKYKNIETDIYSNAQIESQKDKVAEFDRLIYVAGTRAKNALIIGRVFKNSDETQSSCIWNKLSNCELVKSIDILELTIKDNNPETFNIKEQYDKSVDIIKSDSVSKIQTFNVVVPSKLKVRSIISGNDAFEDVEYLDEKDGEKKDVDKVSKRETITDADVKGQMIHKLMESLVVSKNNVDLKMLAKQISNDYDLDFESNLITIGETMLNGGYSQETDVQQDLLSELLNAEEVYCEVPFCYHDSVNSIFNGYIDVVYRKSDKWFIIDYKTNYENKDLEFKYHEQLQQYKGALKRLLKVEAKAFIYHIKQD